MSGYRPLSPAELLGGALSEDEKRIARHRGFTDEQRRARQASNTRLLNERDEGRAFGAVLWRDAK